MGLNIYYFLSKSESVKNSKKSCFFLHLPEQDPHHQALFSVTKPMNNIPSTMSIKNVINKTNIVFFFVPFLFRLKN